MSSFDDRDSYSAPVRREVRDFLKGSANNLRDRLAIFHNRTMDSIDLHGLADELEGIARDYRDAADAAIDEHREGASRADSA